MLFHDFAQSSTLRGLHIDHYTLRFHLRLQPAEFLESIFDFIINYFFNYSLKHY